MTQPVNTEPLIPRALTPETIPGVISTLKDLIRGLFSELRSHATALNATIATEGTWTPTITAATPGNLTVVYSTRIGRYIKRDKFITLQFELQTSTWTHTTAAGDLIITGNPFASVSSPQFSGFMTFWSGFTSAGFTQLGARFDSANNHINLAKSGSGSAAANVAVTDFPTGGTVRLTGEVTYKAA